MNKKFHSKSYTLEHTLNTDQVFVNQVGLQVLPKKRLNDGSAQGADLLFQDFQLLIGHDIANPHIEFLNI